MMKELNHDELKKLNGGIAPIVYLGAWASVGIVSMAAAYYKGYSDAEKERCPEEDK